MVNSSEELYGNNQLRWARCTFALCLKCTSRDARARACMRTHCFARRLHSHAKFQTDPIYEWWRTDKRIKSNKPFAECVSFIGACFHQGEKIIFRLLVHARCWQCTGLPSCTLHLFYSWMFYGNRIRCRTDWCVRSSEEWKNPATQ